MVIGFNGSAPDIHSSAYVHHSATVIGDVRIGAESSLWFNVVVRGDVHHIRIGSRTNLQDHVVVHVTRDRWPTVVGDGVTVAHGVILHGCTIRDRCLIGIGAIVLDGAEIEPECLVAAGSLVSPRSRIPAGHLVMGRPATAVRPLRPEELAQVRTSAAHYVAYAAAYRAEGIT